MRGLAWGWPGRPHVPLSSPTVTGTRVSAFSVPNGHRGVAGPGDPVRVGQEAGSSVRNAPMVAALQHVTWASRGRRSAAPGGLSPTSQPLPSDARLPAVPHGSSGSGGPLGNGSLPGGLAHAGRHRQHHPAPGPVPLPERRGRNDGFGVAPGAAELPPHLQVRPRAQGRGGRGHAGGPPRWAQELSEQRGTLCSSGSRLAGEMTQNRQGRDPVNSGLWRV